MYCSYITYDIMLTYGEINRIKTNIINDYRKNCGNYKVFLEYYQKDICSKKYSAGGDIFPYGMYFISKIREKEYNEAPGHFTDNSKKNTFEYCYSSDGKLKIITRKNSKRTFLQYNGDSVSLFSYNINCSANSPKYLIAIGYDYAEKNRKIFVGTSMNGCSNFSLDIEEQVIDGDSVTGYSYHLMSGDYQLIYGEDTPDEIFDDCAVFHYDLTREGQ